MNELLKVTRTVNAKDSTQCCAVTKTYSYTQYNTDEQYTIW